MKLLLVSKLKNQKKITHIVLHVSVMFFTLLAKIVGNDLFVFMFK